jgi:preprotein translocase subunit SecG
MHAARLDPDSEEQVGLTGVVGAGAAGVTGVVVAGGRAGGAGALTRSDCVLLALMLVLSVTRSLTLRVPAVA